MIKSHFTGGVSEQADMSRVVRKPAFCICEKTKTQISFAVTAKLISAFVFAIRIEHSLYYLNPKFQASSHLLWLYSPVCVGPGRKPRRPVFSEQGSYVKKQSPKDGLRRVVSKEPFLVITQICPCNILQYFTAVKMVIFR